LVLVRVSRDWQQHVSLSNGSVSAKFHLGRLSASSCGNRLMMCLITTSENTAILQVT